MLVCIELLGTDQLVSAFFYLLTYFNILEPPNDKSIFNYFYLYVITVFCFVLVFIILFKIQINLIFHNAECIKDKTRL